MMKRTPALLVLLATTAATAEPLHLGFGDRPAASRSPRVAGFTVPAPRVATTESGAVPVAAEPRAEQPRTVFGLPKNVGPVDRVLRTVVGAALLGAGIWGLASDDHLSTTTSGVLMGVSAVPLATAATAYCPLYQALGIHSSF